MADAGNFYLATPIEHKKHLRIVDELISQEFMDTYNLHDKVKNGYVQILHYCMCYVWITASRHLMNKTLNKEK